MYGPSKVGHSSQPQDRGPYHVHLQNSANMTYQKEYPATFQACQNSVVGVDICPTVLWAPATTAIPDEHGKTLACLWTSAVWQAPTPAIPEEDGANLPHASDINRVSGAYNRLIPYGVGNKT